MITPKKLHWNINSESDKSLLSISDTIITALVSGTPPIKAQTIKSTDEMGQNMESAQRFMSFVTSLSVVLSTMSLGSPAGPVVQIIRLFKIFYR